MHEYALSGCASRPLASYLKALGILRILGEQADRSISGWWRENGFVCRTELDAASLEDFFVSEYAPTPIVAPWNGGSGFLPGDTQDGIRAIEQSMVARFQDYREVISQIRSWPEIESGLGTLSELVVVLSQAAASSSGKTQKTFNEMLGSINAQVERLQALGEDTTSLALNAMESKGTGVGKSKSTTWAAAWKVVKKARTIALQLGRSGDKDKILAICRARLPESCLSWLDAAFVLGPEGNASYNPILGTGGNEGRLDYTNNFMQQVANLLLNVSEQKRRSWWRSAVFGEFSDGMCKGSIGQYDPGQAGGYNQGMGIEKKDFKINPWDYVLMMEGTLLFASALVRKSSSSYRSIQSSPFSVHFSPVGFASSEQSDDGRGEIWLPLWDRSAGLPELRHLFAEGRSSLARRPARNGMEFVRALGLLGVDRGIKAFERFTFLKRRGQSYVALPAGKIPVAFHPELELLGDLDRPLQSIDHFLREFKTLPASLSQARRALDEALFACAQNPSSISFQTVLRSFGRLDSLISGRDRSKKPIMTKPVFGLSTKWLNACDDGSLEMRLAVSIASIKQSGGVGSFRSSLAPVEPSKPWNWATGKGQAEWSGNSLSERLGGVLLRRMMDAERTAAPAVPFAGALALAPEDAAAYAMGLFDPVMLEELLWGFSLVSFGKGIPEGVKSRWRLPVQQVLLPREWCLLKLMHSPLPVRKIKIRFEPRISRLLRAGRLQEACETAEYRLRVSGVTPFKAVYDSRLDIADLLASLLIPVFHQDVLERAVLLPPVKTT